MPALRVESIAVGLTERVRFIAFTLLPITTTAGAILSQRGPLAKRKLRPTED